MKTNKKNITYAFIDASKIIYGTRNEGWKVDFKKLFKYLSERYNCKKVYYFTGVDKKNEKQDKFYKKLKLFGYELILKLVKIYIQEDGSRVRKANCDVDLTFYVMRDKEKFQRGIFMMGDGDFEILLKHLSISKKEIVIIANLKRTAKEIKRLQGIQFNDLFVLKQADTGKTKKTIKKSGDYEHHRSMFYV